ncbi:hypothetical protein [Ornithinimicrobium sp. INDO-MA30-4]|uniref:hypothetical protein n=1 Tax=Ornithinimicrobium sp. INDO-MA30-4 TaxID=2908651 RepID=UPI001F1958B7|nr:hypothetical protein [Ornithinimicrobium sp. INDO-MA30-4]UJH70444.1 hypothetical protein L0A91_15250 [Ornithinimicrobium sp. INDO-MA30-4]
MTARVSNDQWEPLQGALPQATEVGRVYVIPTRTSGGSNTRDRVELYYPDNVRYLPKAARLQNLPVEFSQPEGGRHYVQEFGVDPETWSLGLAFLSLANDWLILTVSLFIAHRADLQGWTTEQAEQLPLKVLISETGTLRNWQIEGSGSEVLEALRILRRGATEDDRGA